MCGLVGYFGDPVNTIRPLEITKWLLHFDAIRGEDSTGVALRKEIQGQGTRLILAKAPGIPGNLYRKFPEIFSSTGDFYTREKEKITMVIGHNRWKTIGGSKVENAHPFHHGAIVGAHNGTITLGLNQLPSSDAIKGDTDSEKLFYALAYGKTLQEVVNTVTGALALTWYDTRDKTMNLYRNSERPLWVVEDHTGTTVLWASEKWMLDIAIGKTKNKAFYKDPVELPVDTLWSFSVHQYGKIIKVAREVKKVEKQYGYNWQGQGAHRTVFTDAEEDAPPDYLKNTKPRTGGWLDMSGLTKEEFGEMTRYGCAFCVTPLTFEEHERGDTFFLESHLCLCSNCAKEFKIGELV